MSLVRVRQQPAACDTEFQPDEWNASQGFGSFREKLIGAEGGFAQASGQLRLPAVRCTQRPGETIQPLDDRPLTAPCRRSTGGGGIGGIEMLATYLWVAIGGALGSMARLGLGTWVAALTGPAFPWGTLLINVLGSFVIGLFGALTGPNGTVVVPPEARAFVMVGICGGFTTFSSFSLQTLELVDRGAILPAVGYIVGSVALCLIFVWVGVALGI